MASLLRRDLFVESSIILKLGRGTVKVHRKFFVLVLNKMRCQWDVKHLCSAVGSDCDISPFLYDWKWATRPIKPTNKCLQRSSLKALSPDTSIEGRLLFFCSFEYVSCGKECRFKTVPHHPRLQYSCSLTLYVSAHLYWSFCRVNVLF